MFCAGGKSHMRGDKNHVIFSISPKQNFMWTLHFIFRPISRQMKISLLQMLTVLYQTMVRARMTIALQKQTWQAQTVP